MITKEEGFNCLEEKGLFTFYKEQEESQKLSYLSPYKIHLRRQRSNDSYNQQKSYIAQKSSNKVLNNFDSFDNKIVLINSKKETHNRSPFKITNPKVMKMNESHSSKRAELKAKSIVELSFEAMSARRQVHKQALYVLKGRAKTQANQIQARHSPIPKIQRRPQARVYSQLQNNYFSQKIQKHSPKKSTIFFRLKKEDTLSKIKLSNKNIKPFLTTQPSQIINEKLVVKGVQNKVYQQKKLSIEVRKAELLPQLKKDKGSSIDFWEYFQERKIFFINRYKKAKANKMRQMTTKQKKNNNS